MKEIKAPDKITQQMTRGGAVEVNKATGGTERISGRDMDVSPDTNSAELIGGAIDRVLSERRAMKKRAVKKENAKIYRRVNRSPETSRLQFTNAERADPALSPYIKKSDRAADRYEKARGRISKEKIPTIERVSDKPGGKTETRLTFRERDKPPNGKLKHAMSRPGREAALAVHNEVRKSDNTGIETAHFAERRAEGAARKIHAGYKHMQFRPYRAAAKAEEKAFKANVKVRYERSLRRNPELEHANPVKKAWHKRKIKRDYAKQFRQRQSTLDRVKRTAQKAKETTEKTIKFAVKHWRGLLLFGGGLLLLILLFSGLSSCGAMLQGGFTSVVTTTYPSKEQDMLTVEAAYAAMETELQEELDNIETLYPNYDEYRYDLDNIGHDPHALAAYLSAMYMDYTLDEVRQELERVFGMQYTLTLTEEIEVRYRTETRTDSEGNSYTVQVPYNYFILNVTLINNGLVSVAQSALNTEQLEMFNIYQETKGNMPLLFGGGSIDINPSENLSGVHFVNGVRPGNQEVVDIAKSQVGNVGGQPYWSWYGFNGRVEWCACFVSWCINQAGYSEPRFSGCTSGGMAWFQSHGQWATRGYSDLAPGDLIFFDWDNSGDADHVGIVIGTDGTKVYTVEGNSGDACKIKSYSLDYGCILGYGLMNW